MSRNTRPPFARLLVLLALSLAGAAWWWFANEDGERLRHPRVDASDETDFASAFEPPPDLAPIAPERALAATAGDDADRPGFLTQLAEGHAPLIGRVMQTNGGLVGAGVRVLALLPQEIDDLPQVERVRDGAVEERRVFTDGDGSFRFPDLPVGVRYHVMAGGRGFVSRHVGPDCVAGDIQMIRVGAVYGLALRLVQEGGAPLPTRCDFGPTLARRDAKIQDEALRDRLRAVVAGVRLEQLDADRRGHLLLHVEPDAAGESLGPWTFTLEEAGFLPRIEEIALTRMGDELATRTCELVPVPGVRFGAIDVRLVGWPEEFTRPAPDARLGQINLDPSREYGSEWILVLKGRDLDGRRVEGVPEGRWPMTFHAASKCYALFAMSGEEPLVADVGAGTSELVIDLRGAGHLRLEVAPLTIDGRTIDRSIHIVPRGGGHAAQHRAVDGLLELPFLRPGDYVARTQRRDSPGVLIHESWCSVGFTITAGAVARCELKVDD